MSEIFIGPFGASGTSKTVTLHEALSFPCSFSTKIVYRPVSPRVETGIVKAEDVGVDLISEWSSLASVVSFAFQDATGAGSP